jgi:hypothetical protein
MLNTFFKTVEDYAEANGTTPANVVRRVTGNAYSWDRMQRKAETLADDVRRVTEYMHRHPVDDTQDCANRHNIQEHEDETRAAE